MSEIFKKLSLGQNLTEQETYDFIFRVMSDAQGEEHVSDAEIGAFLMGGANRLPGVEELIGGARSLREHMTRVELGGEFKPLVDTCGTGGSGLDTFSTSTASAFVVAGAGVYVAKHGNRAASSRSGSADVLEALGLNLALNPEQIKDCITKTNFGFMFAPGHHPATKRVVMARKALKIRTLFNFLGPLSNPAGADCQVLGVSVKEMVRPMAEALGSLGTRRAMVVHGSDGLDEITTTGATYVCELNNGKLKEYEINPKDFGIDEVSFSDISGDVPSQNAKVILEILKGVKGPYFDLVTLNAAAAVYVAGNAISLDEGLSQARESIESGSAMNVLEQLREISRG